MKTLGGDYFECARDFESHYLKKNNDFFIALIHLKILELFENF